MAIDRTPVLKKCRSLGIDPSYLGLEKYRNTSEWKKEAEAYKDGRKRSLNKRVDRHVNESFRTAKNAGRKVSEYGLQLKEKQKAKFIYGVLEKPFRNNFEKAKKLKFGTTGENLMILLETRLDNIVFRLGFARTRVEARQIVDHKHILVNGKIVNIPSYTVKAGDVITVSEKAKNKAAQRFKDIVEVTEGRAVPAWLESDKEALSGTVKEYPTREMIDVPVNEVLIVELYSK